jgi:hypothetical protein
VAEPFRRLGQRTADPSDSGLQVDGHCPRIGGATAKPVPSRAWTGDDLALGPR